MIGKQWSMHMTGPRSKLSFAWVYLFKLSIFFPSNKSPGWGGGNGNTKPIASELTLKVSWIINNENSFQVIFDKIWIWNFFWIWVSVFLIKIVHLFMVYS